MRIAISGATGFIGSHLVARLESEGVGFLVLSRNERRARGQFPGAAGVIQWDPSTGGPDGRALEGLDAVVHLAGEPIAQRWTRAARTAIFDSRVLATRLLADALSRLDAPPSALISNSAIGYYGPTDDTPLEEGTAAGTDFLADLCRQWEGATARASAAGIRVIHPRVGIVLGPDGGALAMMLTPFRLGLGGPIGNGRQWMSWVHVEDVVGLILHALRTPALKGPLNATSPEPVTNRDFSKTLGRVLHRPAFLPTPVAGLRLLYGQFADVLATGQRVIPRRALDSGYRFRFPKLEPALRDVLKRG
jgi:hypothetical protein